VIADLGPPLVKRDNAFFTPHPKSPEHSFEIRSQELLGNEFTSPTPACNLFDFLALHFGSYEQAVDHLLNRYFNLASAPSGIAFEASRDIMVQRLKQERQQFEDILALREPFRDGAQSPSLMQAGLYCRRLGLSTDHAWRMFYPAPGEAINAALRLPVAHVRALNPKQVYFVHPYFKNHHTFGVLQIEDETNNLVRILRLNSSRYLWFGLHGCLPDVVETRVFGTREAALKMLGHAVAAGNFRVGFVHVLIDPNAEASQPPMNSGVFLASESTDFNTLCNHRLAFEQFSIADEKRAYADALSTVKWAQYAANQVVAAINIDGEYSPQVAGMVESLQCDPATLNELLGHFKRGNRKDLGECVRQQLEPQEIFLVDGTRVSETSSGYVVNHTESGISSPFTNFLVRFDYSVWFEDREETYYGARVILDGNSVPFLISNEERQNPRAILAKVQQAVNQTGLNKKLPMIIDPTFQKQLVAVLAQQIGNKPKGLGVEFLGWNATKTRFVAPCWAAGVSGLQRTPKILHPRARVIARYFRFQDVQIVEDDSRAVAQARSLISLIAATLTRAFLNQETAIVRILRSPQSLGLLKAVFRPLGQVRPIELGSKRRQVEQILSNGELCGYPIFATCPDNAALDGLNYPLFLLGDSGLPLPECVDDEAVGQIAALSHRIITSLVLYLLRNPEQAHSLITTQAAPSVRELTLEGKRAIEASGGLENFEILESDMPLLHALLARIPPAQAQEYFQYDRPAEVVRIRCQLLPEVTRKPLYQELLSKNPAVKLPDDDYITCPADWILDLLKKFYGRPIVLPDPSPTSV